ncbi:hypothetical protein D3C73_1561680 [compost metagenome]
MPMDFIQTDLFQKIDGCRKTDSSGNNRRSAFEFPRELFPCRFVKADIVDHLAAELNGFHRFQQLLLTI